MAAKPVVLPDTFTGEASSDEWICHFENERLGRRPEIKVPESTSDGTS